MFFLLIIDLCFLITASNKQIFNSTKELVTPIGIPTSKAKSKFETNPVMSETNI